MSKTPQLFHIGPETDEPTPLELAAKNHLAYLKDQGLLGKQHELISQLVLDLAKAVGVGAQSAKTSTPLAAAQYSQQWSAYHKCQTLPPQTSYKRLSRD